ncbi:hypothetical protein P22_0539 [Propionispora sp. 2/2-37]|uniref:Coenzyme F420 hydrogenase/dehydrogenase, beta subunit C-terminal domain n=1 Tax=Propionispora sp. 2/2-37 TaxID=1677858 RepID=UPI0006BB5957|nr:Coenzyme F420 hydrogenase/dehydrogenase, beta subunit C-terminal domain [Propionispora sp. 2/2-37]CUH94473.1 hypothetical protein P22_0539 [Propionispora sp. 2/2-37]
MHNIHSIVDDLLCCGCGACAVICPRQCIRIDFQAEYNKPAIDGSRCVHCKKCLEVCSGYRYYQDIHQAGAGGNEQMAAGALSCYVGKAADKTIQRQAASGGFITALALELLETEKIQGVVCVRQNVQQPLLSECFIARTQEELNKAMGSRYSPVSGSLIMKELLTLPGQYMIVGKPCDLDGIVRLEQKIPVLKEKIYIKIGILCHHTPSRTALYDLLQRNAIPASEVASLRYRGDGWPGKFSVKLKNGQAFTLPYREAWDKYFSNIKYVPTRCLLCGDIWAGQADITVGDPWGEEFKSETDGYSLIIIKNRKAEAIYRSLCISGKIRGRAIDKNGLLAYQQNLSKKVQAKKLWTAAYLICKNKLNRTLREILLSGEIPLQKKLSVLKKVFILMEKRRSM